MSMLRNVLTYMGLGPDEDYEETYLSDVDEPDIDLTEEEEPEEPPRAVGRRRDGRREPRRAVDLDDEDDDPHALRERPDWLASPAPISDANASPRHRGAHDRDTPTRTGGMAFRGDLRGDDDQRDEFRNVDFGESGRGGRNDGLRPLRAVPPDPNEVRADHRRVEARTEPLASTADQEPEHEPEIRLVSPRTLSPRSFGDAKELADEFKAVVPVVMDLQGIDRSLARRLIDFASGVCYALDGSMEKLAPQVFLLIPVGVDVSDEERRRLERRRPTERS